MAHVVRDANRAALPRGGAGRGATAQRLIRLAGVSFVVAGIAVSAGAALAGSAPAKPAKPAAPLPTMRVHFLDVGQGAATLLEFPCGAMLVDTGGEEDSDFHSTPQLVAYLDAFFARRTDLNRTLDVLLLTHPHIDHVRGAPTVLSTYTVKNIVDDGRRGVQEEAVAAMRMVRDFEADHTDLPHLSVALSEFPADGSPLESPVLDPFPECKGVNPRILALWGGVQSDPGWGDDDYGKARYDNDNNHSIVSRVEFGKASLLITGDLEEVAIGDLLGRRAPALLDVDLYEVGHHGSANGTTSALMQEMSPSYAVMEVGPSTRRHSWTAWAYGHPRSSTIDRLVSGVSGTREPVPEPIATGMTSFFSYTIEKAIYATGWDGTVVLEAASDGTIAGGKPDFTPPAP